MNNVAISEGRKRSNKVLVGVLVSLLIVIVALVVGIVIVKHSEQSNTSIDDEIRIKYTMEGFDGVVADSTVALMLKNDITNKMLTNDLYTYQDAINDFDKACTESEGRVRFYIITEYADFVFNNTNDAAQAIQILEKAELPLGDKVAENVFYSGMYRYYSVLGDEEMIKKYDILLQELNGPTIVIPLDVVQEMMGGGGDE